MNKIVVAIAAVILLAAAGFWLTGTGEDNTSEMPALSEDMSDEANAGTTSEINVTDGVESSSSNTTIIEVETDSNDVQIKAPSSDVEIDAEVPSIEVEVESVETPTLDIELDTKTIEVPKVDVPSSEVNISIEE